MISHLSDPVKHAVDYFAVGAFLTSLLTNVMPAITATLTAIWLILRVIEGWQNVKLNNRKLNKRD